MSLRRRLDEFGEQQGRVGVAVVADGMLEGRHQRLHASWAMTSDIPGHARDFTPLSPTLSLTHSNLTADRVCPRRPLAYSIGRSMHGSHAARRLL